MIIDNIKNASLYFNLHKGFEKVFKYLETINNYEANSKEVANNIKSIISDNNLKSKNDSLLEIHRKYIDIHIPLSGNETFGWKPTCKLEEGINEFDLEKDFQLFTDTPNTYFTIHPDEFVIFFPEDAHAPLIGTGELKKIIFKVAVD